MAQSTVYSDIVAPSCKETVQPRWKLSFVQYLVSTVLKNMCVPSTIIIINKKTHDNKYIPNNFCLDLFLRVNRCFRIVRIILSEYNACVIEIVFFDGRT